MNILVRGSSLILLFVLTFSYFGPTTERTAFREGKNVIYFERIECRIYSPNKVSNITCRVKYIDRNNLRVYLGIVVRKPTSAIWIHGIFYYKYYTYQKIATEYWDDLCTWAAGKKMSFFLDYLKPVFNKYTDFNHSCPYTGLVIAKIDNISAQVFALPQIMPAGRYKINFNITEDDRKTSLFGATVYGSVSDHRIEVV